jgi:hypothetical protein
MARISALANSSYFTALTLVRKIGLGWKCSASVYRIRFFSSNQKLLLKGFMKFGAAQQNRLPYWFCLSKLAPVTAQK